MRKPVLISALDLYIINQVRIIRFRLNLNQREVSKILNPLTDNNILGAIESNFRKEKYTDAQLNKLAVKFSELDQKGSYTLNDFYPKSAMEEKLVEKIVIALPKKIGPTASLLNSLESDNEFCKDWQTVKEITDYSNLKEKQCWITKDFTSAIENIVRAGKLIRKSEDEALYKRP